MWESVCVCILYHFDDFVCERECVCASCINVMTLYVGECVCVSLFQFDDCVCVCILYQFGDFVCGRVCVLLVSV